MGLDSTICPHPNSSYQHRHLSLQGRPKASLAVSPAWVPGSCVPPLSSRRARGLSQGSDLPEPLGPGAGPRRLLGRFPDDPGWAERGGVGGTGQTVLYASLVECVYSRPSRVPWPQPLLQLPWWRPSGLHAWAPPAGASLGAELGLQARDLRSCGPGLSAQPQ